MISQIQNNVLNSSEAHSIVYHDNTTCIAKIHRGYLKSNIAKHIAPELFIIINFSKVTR